MFFGIGTSVFKPWLVCLCNESFKCLSFYETTEGVGVVFIILKMKPFQLNQFLVFG